MLTEKKILKSQKLLDEVKVSNDSLWDLATFLSGGQMFFYLLNPYWGITATFIWFFFMFVLLDRLLRVKKVNKGKKFQ